MVLQSWNKMVETNLKISKICSSKPTYELKHSLHLITQSWIHQNNVPRLLFNSKYWKIWWREREREKLKFLPDYEENFTFTDDRSSFDLWNNFFFIWRKRNSVGERIKIEITKRESIGRIQCKKKKKTQKLKGKISILACIEAELRACVNLIHIVRHIQIHINFLIKKILNVGAN